MCGTNYFYRAFINFHGWQGCGYIVMNPTTGTGAYMITGGENGARVFWSELLLLLLADLLDSYILGQKIIAEAIGLSFINSIKNNLMFKYYEWFYDNYNGFDWCWFTIIFSALLGIAAIVYGFAYAGMAGAAAATASVSAKVLLVHLGEMALWTGFISTLTGIVSGIVQKTTNIDCVILEP